MKKKSKESFRNAQDIIDSTYNSRDAEILEKSMNAYVMPLDMVKGVDVLSSDVFYEEEWNKIIQEKKHH